MQSQEWSHRQAVQSQRSCDIARPQEISFATTGSMLQLCFLIVKHEKLTTTTPIPSASVIHYLISIIHRLLDKWHLNQNNCASLASYLCFQTKNFHMNVSFTAVISNIDVIYTKGVFILRPDSYNIVVSFSPCWVCC